MWYLAWSAIKSIFQKVWAWIKRNWKFVVGLAIPIVIGLLSRRSTDMSEIIERISDDYEREIDVIEDAHSEKILAHKKATERYHETIAEVENRYHAANREFDKKKQKEIAKLIKDNKDDPDEITRKLAELTGFKIHVD